MALNNSAAAARVARAISPASESSTNSPRGRSKSDSCGQNDLSGRNLLDEPGPQGGAAAPTLAASEVSRSASPVGTGALT